MIKLVLTAFILAISLPLQQVRAEYQTLSDTSNIKAISWSSGEGQARLARSKYKQDFFILANNFEAQINPLYCGVATSVIILNSLKLGKEEIPVQKQASVQIPISLGGRLIEYKRFSQASLFNQQTDKVKHRNVIKFTQKNSQNNYDPGLTLAQLKAILETYKLNVSLHYAVASQDAIAKFRNLLIESLNNQNNFIIANFYGKNISLTSSGHISPIAAYDQESDSILILDVAGHKNPWYWIDIKEFYQAMSSKDGDNFRGYLLVTPS